MIGLLARDRAELAGGDRLDDLALGRVLRLEARDVLTEAGLAIEVDETVTIREPQGDATFLWLMGRK